MQTLLTRQQDMGARSFDHEAAAVLVGQEGGWRQVVVELMEQGGEGGEGEEGGGV
jgi:hypothetical protein